LARKIQAFTLFATHYFELITLPDECPGVQNVHLDAVEHGDRVVFLHAVKDGPANQSYGLQVAALAGVPRTVIDNARKKLTVLENQTYAEHQSEARQFDLFANAEPHPALDLLRTIRPEEITPKQALDLLFTLKDLTN
jgi:DNA mismatch repair protein MutS